MKITQFLIILCLFSAALTENREENARYIYKFFKAKGWTLNAIAGMLGNMQAESNIIADIDEKSGGGGYGLVQWTPKSKLVNWANQNGLDHRTVDTQCRRIQWELENNKQFSRTKAYPMTFKEYVKSTESAPHLVSSINDKSIICILGCVNNESVKYFTPSALNCVTALRCKSNF